MNISPMTINDYDEMLILFKETPGVAVREADSREITEGYLERNKGLSFVVRIDEKLVGCVMCGHDSRRGYLQHLVVNPQYRGQGIGKKLVERTIKALEKIGIKKTHIFVFKANNTGNQFWINRGWKLRDDVNMYSFINSANENV